jgi:hypothetical protein
MCAAYTLEGGLWPDRKRNASQESQRLKKYLALVKRIENYFKGFTIERIERNKNTKADE